MGEFVSLTFRTKLFIYILFVDQTHHHQHQNNLLWWCGTVVHVPSMPFKSKDSRFKRFPSFLCKRNATLLKNAVPRFTTNRATTTRPWRTSSFHASVFVFRGITFWDFFQWHNNSTVTDLDGCFFRWLQCFGHIKIQLVDSCNSTCGIQYWQCWRIGRCSRSSCYSCVFEQLWIGWKTLRRHV